jgi:hypothetical protein
VDDLAQERYKGRYIVQRNNVSATIPLKQDADNSTAWWLLADAADESVPTAGQALGESWENEGYRMNGGNNCNHDDLSCSTTCQGECCEGDCVLDWGSILQHSADHLITYSASYYEIYPPDAGNLKDVVSAIHVEFNPTP